MRGEIHKKYASEGFAIHDVVAVDLASLDHHGARDLIDKIDEFPSPDYRVISGRFVPDALMERELITSKDKRYFVVYKKHTGNEASLR